MDLIDSQVKDEIKRRSLLNTVDNITKVFAAGTLIASQPFFVEELEWLRTKSLDPRPEHLANVGERRKPGELFPSGEPLPNLKINCKCGIKEYTVQ